MKCPSCPTICQQNVKTSIQVTAIYTNGENWQTKIKKSASGYFQQGNLCYAHYARINIFILRNIWRLTFMQFIQIFPMNAAYLSD
ncbi:MAG TPA: hypothetical protein DIS97_11270 [Citrobacter freundii]|nr:hypothetical protein [Citrobacter freundii]